MKTAVYLPGFLNYSLGGTRGRTFIIITYYLKKDVTITVEAWENSVFRKGSIRKIHGDNGCLFLNIVDGYYFGD